MKTADQLSCIHCFPILLVDLYNLNFNFDTQAMLMNVEIDGLFRNDFDFEQALNLWKNEKQRRIFEHKD